MMTDRLRALYAAGHVKRLHAVQTIFEHTIATHTYGMGCVAAWLCDKNGLPPEEKARVLEAVLYHDGPESATGDMPANIKKNHPEISAALLAEEGQWYEGNSVPDLSPVLSETQAAILDVADRIDLAMTCVYERSMGNSVPQMATIFNRAIMYARENTGKVQGVEELATWAQREWMTVGGLR